MCDWVLKKISRVFSIKRHRTDSNDFNRSEIESGKCDYYGLISELHNGRIPANDNFFV